MSERITAGIERHRHNRGGTGGNPLTPHRAQDPRHLANGTGKLKAAKALGVGISVVQRIAVWI
jgi:hypothetical protein